VSVPAVSLDLHGDKSLEALIPTEIGGEKLTISSMNAAVFAGGSNSDLNAVLTRLGRSINDVSLAGGTAVSGLNIVAIRVAGANQDALMNEIVTAGQKDAGSPAPSVTHTNIGGKDFVSITPAFETPEPVSLEPGESPEPTETPDVRKVEYLYGRGDVIFQVSGATPAQLTEVAGKLP
jgi:hypothetical protein